MVLSSIGHFQFSATDPASDAHALIQLATLVQACFQNVPCQSLQQDAITGAFLALLRVCETDRDMGAVNAIAMGALETVVETVFCGREPYEATHKPAPDSPTVVRLKLLSWLVRLLRNAVFKQSLTESAGPRRNELVLPKLSRARAGHIAASLLYTIVAAPLFAIKGSLQSAIKDQLFPVLFEGFQWTEYNLEELSHADGPITYGGSLDFTDITRGFRAGIHTDVKVAALKQLRTKLLSCLRHLLATCAAEVPSYAMEIHHLVHRSVLLQMTKYLEVTRVTLQSDPAQPVLPSLAQLLAAPTRDQGASPQATIDSIGDVLSAVQHMTSLEQQQPASLFQCFLLFDCYFSGSPVVNTLFQTIASAASRVIKEPQRMMDSDGNSSVASSHEGYLDEGRVAAILAHSSTALQQAACQFFHAVLTGLQRRFNSLEVDGSMIEAWHGREGEVPTAITQKTALLQGCMLFNQKPAKGVKHWQAAGLLPEPTDPAAVAYFLRNVPFLLPERVGEMLGAGDGEQHTLLRRHFVSQFDFEGTPILDCLRMFLQSFRLPGEAQQIDRILQTFAESAHFQCAESSLLPSVDTTYLLSFALIMLNTDIHNPNIKPERKMSKEAFVRNNRDYGDEVSHGVKLTDAFLSSLYTSIANEEIAQPTAFDGLLPLYEGVFGLNRSSTNPDCEDRFLMPLYNDSLWHDLRQRHQHRTNVGAASHAMTAAEAENPTNTEESTRIASADAHTAAGTRLEWLQSTNRLLQQAANVASLPTGASASKHDRPETVELARFYADTAINPAMDTFLTVLVFSPVPADTPESPPSSPDSLFQTTAAGQPASPMHHTSSINEGITMCAEVAAGLGLHNTVNDIVCALFSIGSRAVLQVRDKGTVKQPAKRSTDAELRAGWAACLRQEPVTAQQPGAQSQPRADGLFAQLRRLRPQHTAHMEGLGNSSMAASRTALGMAFRLCDQYSSVLRQSTIHWMLYTLSQLHHIGCLPPNFGLRASLCRHLHPLAFAPRVSGRAVRFLSEHSAGRKGMGQMHSAANDRGQGNGMFGWLASFWGGESRGSNAAPDLGAGGTRHPHGYGALDSCSSGDDDSCSVHTVAIPFSVGPGKPSQTLSARMTISQAMYWSSNPASLSPELRAVLQLATDARLPNWIQRSSSWSDTQLQQFLHHMTVMMGAASTQESAQAVSGGGAALPRASASPMSQESQGRTGATTAFHLAYKIGMIPCPAAPDADSSESFFLLRLLGGVCSANYTRPQLWWSQLRTVFDLMRQRAITTRIVASTVLLHVTHSLLQGGTAPPTASEESPALPPTNLGRMDSANDSAAGPPSQDRHAATLTAIDAVLAIRPSWQAPLAEDYAAICCTLLHALADEQWVDLQWLMQDGRLQRLCRAAAATKRTSTARYVFRSTTPG